MKIKENIRIKPLPRIKSVAVYCRVSSSKADQMHSLGNQISKLINDIVLKPGQKLYDVYVDVSSGRKNNERKNLNRMISDAEAGLIDIVIVKSISRLYRDAEFLLRVVRKFNSLGVEVFFENEDISSVRDSAELMTTLMAAVAQAESDGKSENIRWGIRKAMSNPNSKMNNRVFYGYQRENGKLVIDEAQAEVVRTVFDLYVHGYSILRIIDYLYQNKIPSPRGNEKWSKHSIEVILENERYTGVKKCMGIGVVNIVKEHHPGIISPSLFDDVKLLRKERSNIEYNENGDVVRKTTRYKSK